MRMGEEWVSVSEFARRAHKSTTYVYSLIHEEKVAYRAFKRGKYVGYLVKFKFHEKRD